MNTGGTQKCAFIFSQTYHFALIYGGFFMASRDVEIKNQELRDRIEGIREHYPITNIKLAQLLGISKESLSRFLNGKERYSFNTIRTFERVLTKLEEISKQIEEMWKLY